MPRAKKDTNGAVDARDNGGVQWGGFIDIRLTPEEKEAFLQWSEPAQWSYLDDLLADEIKLGLTYETETETYLATLTSIKHAGSNLRVVLTSRSGSWERAVMLCLYKHFILLEGDWGRYRVSTNRAAEV